MPAILFQALQSLAREHPTSVALWTRSSAASYSEVLASSEAWAKRLMRFAGSRVGVALFPADVWLAVVAACDELGISIVLLNPQTESSARLELARSMGLAALVADEGESVDDLRAAGPSTAALAGTVTILTSGTTGEPKKVVHTWETLSRPIRVQPQFLHSKWLLTYPLHLYAGLQVFLQCFWNAGTLYLLPPERDPGEISKQIADEKIEYISATPSFLRRLLAFGSRDDLRRASLRNITLGGEAVSDDILQHMQGAFPQARISHIYASSELGRCFTVTDSRAGFPAAYLDHAPEPGVELRILDSELQLRSPNRMRGYDKAASATDDGWFPTGDLVELVGDRVLFRGRTSEIINIGGNKVHPFEVETVLREIPGVAEAHVHAVASSLVGSLLGARIAAQPGVDQNELKKAVAEHCSRRLLAFQRPRILEFVSKLQLSEANKVTRRGVGA